MITTFPSVTLNNLDDVTFIGGTYKKFHFKIYDEVIEEGNLITYSMLTALWNLYPFYKDTPSVLTKTGIFNTTGYDVLLYSEDTEDLYGKYLQTFSMTGIDGYEQIVGRGIVYILPRIGIKGKVYT
jgi:hypothetical protein